MGKSALLFARFVGLFCLLLLAVAACQPQIEEEPQVVAGGELSSQEAAVLARISVDSAPINIDAIPDVDTSRAVVPLDEILFDTFQRYDRIVPLSKAEDDLILSLRDAIPPIYQPKFESSQEAAQWLSETDLVLGYRQDEIAIAYPIKILNWHEIASHEVDGIPIMATY